MTVVSRPQFDTAKVEQHYSEKDGVPIKYVCTTELKSYGHVYDIFYRETPHPEFGNKYFGLTRNGDFMYIGNADSVEDLKFDAIADNVGNYHYSQYTHDFHSVGDCAIDGGRSYTRRVGNINKPVKTFIVRNGQFEELKYEH